MFDADRARRACEDVLAVELFAPGMARVVSLGGAYTVDARGEGCQCPDKEFNLEPGNLCKHHAAAFLASSDDHPTPFLVVEDLDARTEPAFDLEVPDRIGHDRQLSAFETDGGRRVATDGGEDVPRDDCWCADNDLPCFDHFTTEDSDE